MRFIRRKRKQYYKCYIKEIAEYRHFYYSVITTNEAKHVLKILQKKFKIKPKTITWNETSKWFGGWTSKDGSMKFYKNVPLNLLIVCHEYSHLICFKKNINGHGYKFYKQLKEIIKYIESQLIFKLTK